MIYLKVENFTKDGDVYLKLGKKSYDLVRSRDDASSWKTATGANIALDRFYSYAPISRKSNIHVVLERVA